MPFGGAPILLTLNVGDRILHLVFLVQEAVNLVQSRISLERLETKKEERKIVLAPSSLLLKSPRVIDLKHGIRVREADSIVGLSLDPIAVRMVFLQLADSLVLTNLHWSRYLCIFPSSPPPCMSMIYPRRTPGSMTWMFF